MKENASRWVDDANFDSQWLKRIGNSSRLLYGSDWPLTPMRNYIEFIRTLFPDHDDQEKVFYKNALSFLKIKLP